MSFRQAEEEGGSEHESDAVQALGLTVRTGGWVGFVWIHAGPGLEGLCGAVYEQPPETLGQDRGFVGIRTALHADRAVAIEDMDRQGFGVFGGDEHATQRASFPELATVESGARRRQRSVIVTNN